MVEQSGKSSNFLALEEMVRWGVIIEEIRSFSSHYGCDAKQLFDRPFGERIANFNNC